MIIKKLQLSNFQCIEKFDAEFEGNVYFITGENELGKSTLLKAIGVLLTGERDAVLRNGAEKGFAKMVVGDDGEQFNVELSFTEKNPRGTMTIKQAATGMQTNNISMLQKIFGYQDFDAVEFSRWSETAEGRRKQIAVVKSLLPESVRERIEAIDADVAELKSQRQDINREAKTFEGYVDTISKQLDEGDIEKYQSPVDMSVLLKRQQENAALVERAKTVRTMLEQRREQLAAIPARLKESEDKSKARMKEVDEYLEQARIAYENAQLNAKEKRATVINEYQSEVAQIEADKTDIENRIGNAEGWLKKYEDSGVEKSNVPDLLAAAEKHNGKYRVVCEYKERKAKYDDCIQQSAKMTEKIEQLAKDRAGLIAGAELPVKGLTFTEDSLELNGVPFVPGKVSDSQQMELATKLIIASNPTVNVFRIARGESLGQKRLQDIIDIAKRNGFQGFIEQVKRGQDDLRVEEYTEGC